MIYDSIIIGSGVAGLTAGLYLARAQKKVLIIEDSVLGGTTATLNKIENYPGFLSVSGMELVQNMVMQISNLGVSIDFINIKSIDFNTNTIITDMAKLQYKTLIIASGTSYNKLQLKEENKYKFKGLSYCAVCDGNLYKGKNVVVATNGNSGKDAIEYMQNLTKNIVVIDYGNSYNNDKCTVYNNSMITKINGNPFVESVEIINSEGKTINIDCQGLFVSLGKSTNLNMYKDYLTIKDNYIVTDENMKTNIDGVYAAGDIRYKSLRQIITACSDGAIAGTECIKYLSK